MISEAEVKGEKILDAAHRRAAKLAEDIREMKALRSRLGAALRTTIETHLALLDTLTAEPAEEDPVLEGKVAYLTRRARPARLEPAPGGAPHAAPTKRPPRCRPTSTSARPATTSSSASSASAIRR